MKAVRHPPEIVLRAYADLVSRAFLFIRSQSRVDYTGRDDLHDLADAMHNIGSMFSDYGAWADDAKYRELYLRPFDAKWATSTFGLEEFIESRISELSRE